MPTPVKTMESSATATTAAAAAKPRPPPAKEPAAPAAAAVSETTTTRAEHFRPPPPAGMENHAGAGSHQQHHHHHHPAGGPAVAVVGGSHHPPAHPAGGHPQGPPGGIMPLGQQHAPHHPPPPPHHPHHHHQYYPYGPPPPPPPHHQYYPHGPPPPQGPPKMTAHDAHRGPPGGPPPDGGHHHPAMRYHASYPPPPPIHHHGAGPPPPPPGYPPPHPHPHQVYSYPGAYQPQMIYQPPPPPQALPTAGAARPPSSPMTKQPRGPIVAAAAPVVVGGGGRSGSSSPVETDGMASPVRSMPPRGGLEVAAADASPDPAVESPQIAKEEDAADEGDGDDDYRADKATEQPQDGTPGERKIMGKAPSAGGDPSVTKPEKDAPGANATTPATVNETMSQISPSALDTTISTSSRQPQGHNTGPSSAGVAAHHHVYQTLRKPHPQSSPLPPQSSPTYHSHGSFSRITGPGSAYYASGPPPPGSTPGRSRHHHLGGGGGGNGPPPQGQHPHPSYVYQYQHFDPRSHVEVSTAPPRRGQHRFPAAPTPTNGNANNGSGGHNAAEHHHHPYAGGGYPGAVPPTVHMPNAPIVKDVSPLANFSAIKPPGKARRGRDEADGGVGGRDDNDIKGPATPRGASRETEAAVSAMSQLQSGGDGKMDGPAKSPLDLLSSVSSSPVAKEPVGHDLSWHRASNPTHADAQNYTYPPAPQSYPPPSSQSRYHQHAPPPIKTERSSLSPIDPTSTPGPKSLLACDLILSAANTLDHEDSKAGKKRKLSGEHAEGLKKKLQHGFMNEHNHHHHPQFPAEQMSPPGSHKKAPAPNNLFSVGGYPPGFDPTTLPPSRSSLKPPAKSLKGKILDTTTVTQAQQASMLAQQALERPRVGKQLLLSMALVRTNPRTPPSCYPSHGTILTDRFHWAAFPPLDSVLRRHMKKYYELSTNKCQSRDQQEFNNELVHKIRLEASKYGWEFDDKAFDDKKIRDRIRCFFKTHIQNAKKRLKTMLRNPEKRANIKALAAHFHLIEEKGLDCEHDHEEDSDDGLNQGRVEHDSLGFGLSASYSNELGDNGGNNNNYHHPPPVYGNVNHDQGYGAQGGNHQSYGSGHHQGNHQSYGGGQNDHDQGDDGGNRMMAI